MYVCVYVCMCTVCVQPLVIINKSKWNVDIYTPFETPATSMWNNVAGCISRGTTFATEWNNAEWVSEWVSHPPQRVRAAAGCAWWCAGQCARKRRTTEAPPGFCPSSCNSGPNRVWFSFFLLSLFLYFSLLFALSLVLPFPFPFYFCLVQYSCSFCIAAL